MFPERQRPSRLSNRNCCYSDGELAAIDAKEIGQLGWREYEAIFALSGCTAEYDEQLYYLPPALNYLRENPGVGNEFVAGLVSFIANHRQRLETDGLLEAALAELRACLNQWTSTFAVIHFDNAGDHVENSGAVSELIDRLLQHGLDGLVEEVLDSWIAVRRSPLESAWLLEFAKEARAMYEDHPENDGASSEFDRPRTNASRRVSGIVMNTLLLQGAYDEIKDTIAASEASSTYWNDVTGSLGLTA